MSHEEVFNITLKRSSSEGKCHLSSFQKHYQPVIQTDTTASVFNCAAGKKDAYDPTGQTSYMEACEMLQVLPASYFLRHMQNKELSMMYHGLGPQVL